MYKKTFCKLWMITALWFWFFWTWAHTLTLETSKYYWLRDSYRYQRQGALTWFQSYLTNHTQYVCIQRKQFSCLSDHYSKHFPIDNPHSWWLCCLQKSFSHLVTVLSAKELSQLVTVLSAKALLLPTSLVMVFWTQTSTMSPSQLSSNICNIRLFRSYLTDEATMVLVHAFITSTLDDCNHYSMINI